MNRVIFRRMGGRVIEVEFFWPENKGYYIYQVDLKNLKIVHYTSFSVDSPYVDYDVDEDISSNEELKTALEQRNLIPN